MSARIPPNDDSAEQALLGAMLLRAEAIEVAYELVQARDFYRPAHQHIYDAIIGLWLDATEDETRHAAWTNSLWHTIRHEGSGVYVNFLENEGDERIRDAYPSATLARLREVKRAYDPHNLFRFNQNIRPAGRP